MKATRRIVASSFVAALAGSPSLALAEDTFQGEAGFSYSYLKTGPARQTTAGLEGSLFFDKLPTQPKDYPLEQAQFVERIGSLSANYSQSSLDSSSFDASSRGRTYRATVLLARPDTPFFASAGVTSGNSGKLQGGFGESEIDS